MNNKKEQYIVINDYGEASALLTKEQLDEYFTDCQDEDKDISEFIIYKAEEVKHSTQVKVILKS